jgi:hypothetical protein
MSKNRARRHLARFVDRTAQTETRPVVARVNRQDFQDSYFPSEKLLADFPVSVDSLRVPADWKAP